VWRNIEVRRSKEEQPVSSDNATTRPQPTRPLDIDPDYLAGVLSARRELGPDAEPVVIAAFLERTGHAIDLRVDQRIAQHAAARGWGFQGQAPRGRSSAPRFWLAMGSIVMAVPITGVATEFGGLGGVVVAMIAWIGIVLVNVAFAINRP